MRDQRFESIQPGKWPLDADLLLYESCHALPSGFALDSYNRGRLSRSRNADLQWLFKELSPPLWIVQILSGSWESRRLDAANRDPLRRMSL